MLVLKLQHNDDIRRVTVEKPLSLAELQKLSKSLFGDKIAESFSVKYKDDEGDIITVTNDRELEEAFRIFKEQGIFRFILQDNARSSPKCQRTCPVKDAQVNFQDLLETLAPYVESLECHVNGAIPKIDEFLNQVFGGEKKDENQFVHPAICDSCNQRIVGIRWKCLECPDFDLCNSCKETGKVHAEHKFNKILRTPTIPIPVKVEEPKKEEPKKEEPKPEVRVPLIPLRKVVEETKKEEPKKEEPKKEEPKKEEPKKEEPKKEEPKKEEPKKEEPKKEISPFEAKLKQLEEMGFLNRSRNIELLVKHKGDMMIVIRDLLSA